MPLTVRDLLAIPSLRLELAAGRAGLGNVVEAAHASEMLRPAAWLEGAEVVMTTGLLLAAQDDRDAWAQYAADVAHGGAAALVLGLGRLLPLQDVPSALAEAAETLGLPLLTAPERTPFVAVTKAVFGARAAEERRLLERTLRTQRRLTAATASGDGLDALLRAWQQATGTAVVVCDVLGRLLGAAGAEGTAALAEAAGILDAVALRGLRGSADGDLPSGRVQVQPLGASRLRGFVLLLGAGNAESRLLGSVLVSLLSVELERRHLADEPQRRRRAQLLAQLFTPELPPARARSLLTAAGVRSTAIRAVAVGTGERPGEQPDELAADLAMAAPGGLARVAGGCVELVVGDGVDVEEILRRFAPGRPAGIGPAVAPQHAALSLRQAHALLPTSTELGRPVTTAEAGSVRLLLRLGSPALLSAFADTVLAPLDAQDPAAALGETLRVWLETNGSWAETSKLLGVHRHTVQSRIERIAQLTGRRMDRIEDRVDLWLALQARESAPVLPDSAPSGAP
ncbi:PucR family transcriptional regulator [Actinacidiphila acidipaludis]|uniref:PucR family transcriptional regulator ligand-binding domain-containing protein n=1 Tax=Actinacidiphila acidipaludis TaxID=2873382 RepID=A0ABS7Q7F9_9ACTN|nr:PucR family transcriptional regulator [Streptomyces acidipaludis]MBY8879073.1 PucR family transcriptional regulator ligand-binding domain-containing protein [Streptomyces acidipaludis]